MLVLEYVREKGCLHLLTIEVLNYDSIWFVCEMILLSEWCVSISFEEQKAFSDMKFRSKFSLASITHRIEKLEYVEFV